MNGDPLGTAMLVVGVAILIVIIIVAMLP